MMHIDHPDTHTAGLHPDCPRCQAQAKQPTELDSANLRRIWRGEFHTRLDVEAFNVLYRSMVVAQRVSEAFQVAGLDGLPMSEWPAKDEWPDRLDQFELFTVGGRA